MYVLIKQVGEETSVVAVSESVNLLRQKLVNEAKRILSDYLDANDPYDKKRKKELFASLNNIADARHWCDGDELDPLSFSIEKVPLLKVEAPKTKIKLQCVFGHDATKYSCNYSIDKAVKAVENGDIDGSCPLYEFDTFADMKTACEILNDYDGWDGANWKQVRK